MSLSANHTLLAESGVRNAAKSESIVENEWTNCHFDYEVRTSDTPSFPRTRLVRLAMIHDTTKDSTLNDAGKLVVSHWLTATLISVIAII
jgi:hypothetical protein